MTGQAPIIIKRKKVVKGGGHHGGAWKVAYADFVTAMMAFFLLMWLLNATTEEQRKGIADYFQPSIPIAAISGGGTDALNGDSVLTQEKLTQSGEVHSDRKKKADVPSDEELREQIADLAAGAGIADAKDRIRVTETEEGTVIELVDAAGLPLFTTGSAAASTDLAALIASTAEAVRTTGVDIKITGHTDSAVYSTSGYSNWELSADRANIARRLMIENGIESERIVEVAGKADREPIAENKNAPVNRRIAIVLRKPKPATAKRQPAINPLLREHFDEAETAFAANDHGSADGAPRQSEGQKIGHHINDDTK